MRVVQDIVFGVQGQKLYFDVPEGRPSSVTKVEVFRWDTGDTGDTEAAVGVGTVEAEPTTTLDDTAGRAEADPRKIPVASTQGAVLERDLLLTSANGLREWIEVAAIATDDYIIAKHPLKNNYEQGAALQTTRITSDVEAAWVSDEANLIAAPGPNPMYRVRWEYVVNGVTYVADEYFNLVRYQGWHGVRPQDVEALYPGWLDRLPMDHQADQGRRLIDEAYRAVQLDLEQLGVDDAAIAHSQAVDELARYKTVQQVEWVRFLTTSGETEERHLAAKREYTERLDALVRVTAKLATRDQDGAGEVPKPALGLSVR